MDREIEQLRRQYRGKCCDHFCGGSGTAVQGQVCSKRGGEPAEGQLDWAHVARCRIRHFSDGVMLGSRAFLAGPCRELGRRMGLVREREPRELRGSGLGGPSVFRAWGGG